MKSRKSHQWTEHPDLVDFFTHHRNRPEDMYPSERRFLPWLATEASFVLDVGCAAGGFESIWRHYRPETEYVGVDVSVSMIASARRLHPNAKFLEGDCAAGLLLADRYAPVTQALGWLHLEPRYVEAIRELWRVTDRFLFFDVRLAGNADQAKIVRQKIAFDTAWDGRTTSPYIVVELSLFAALLLSLEPVAIWGFGYWGRPAGTVDGIDHEVCFAAFVLEKAPVGEAVAVPTVCMDMPLPWPACLENRVNQLNSSQLDVLAPRYEP